ncbi:hypothetical protein [Spiroplasma endosymbiont of Danaus chrysippus]|uniref:hypothetical protein n=1 Tax=Spiroplasma endosymbiont of Danaus chrysippus TaxID=2691041 RepID=UPI00157A2420|nr:hypothetical protein [Spiroplasma endosymbiont of Danaus chrysippus]
MKKEWVKLIKVGFMHGVEEPWCNNKGVAILPFIIKNDGSRYFMQTCESNPLFNKNKLGKYSSITGGLENNKHYQTVTNEMLEETGIFFNKRYTYLLFRYSLCFKNKH